MARIHARREPKTVAVRREAPPPVEISRGQAPTPAQNVQVLPARLPRSGMAFMSEQRLVAHAFQLDVKGSGSRSLGRTDPCPLADQCRGQEAIVCLCEFATDIRPAEVCPGSAVRMQSRRLCAAVGCQGRGREADS
jgi:hypothetical protein